MFGIHDFLLFLAAALLLNITPGADMLYTLSSSAAAGTRAGILAALGIFTGTLFHIAFAVAGLSALLAASATAFALVKYVGAAYLVYLGIRLLLQPSGRTAPATTPDARRNLVQVFRQGVLINLFNPKIALFFLAFLPQFIDTDSTQRALAFLLLGLTFNCSGACVNSIAAWFASSVGRRMQGASRPAWWLKKTAGGLFMGLGIRLAFSQG
ncbi:MAG TPA: LysE family translocator [Salinisphaeraceae bacterium]|nr:LysE family translocator [Salinisphaeraceae bacterium]